MTVAHFSQSGIEEIAHIARCEDEQSMVMFTQALYQRAFDAWYATPKWRWIKRHRRLIRAQECMWVLTEAVRYKAASSE